MAKTYTAPIVWRSSLFGGKEETTSGTSVLSTVTGPLTGTAGAACSVLNGIVEPAIDVIERGIDMADGSPVPAVIGATPATVSFTTELIDTDANDEMLTAAGMLAAASVWKPTSSMASRKTWSFGQCYEGGIVKGAYGVALDLEVILEVGQRVLWNWNGRGIWAGQSDPGAMWTNPTVGVPLMCKGMTLTHGAGPTHWQQPQRVVIRLNNDVQLRYDMAVATAADTTGIAHAYIASRNVTIELDPETQADGTLDNYDALTACTAAAFNAVIVDAAGATALTINCPATQRISVSQAERAGYRTDAIVLRANRNSAGGDDEISFTFVSW